MTAGLEEANHVLTISNLQTVKEQRTNMEVPKNAFACAICQKTFNNPTILIKHVEFRHSSAKQSPKSKVGPELKDKDPIINVNEDPLETNSASDTASFEFIQPLQNFVQCFRFVVECVQCVCINILKK